MSEACEICGKPSSVKAKGGSINGVQIPDDRPHRFCLPCTQDAAKLSWWVEGHG